MYEYGLGPRSGRSEQSSFIISEEFMSPGAVLGKMLNSQKVKLLHIQSQLLWTLLGDSNYLVTMFHSLVIFLLYVFKFQIYL